MDALVDALGEAGYDVARRTEDAVPVCSLSRQLAELRALSADVEAATLQLQQLQGSASLDDLVGPEQVRGQQSHGFG